MDMNEYHELMREVARLKREHPGQYTVLIAFAERFRIYVSEEHRKMRSEKITCTETHDDTPTTPPRIRSPVDGM